MPIDSPETGNPDTLGLNIARHIVGAHVESIAASKRYDTTEGFVVALRKDVERKLAATTHDKEALAALRNFPEHFRASRRDPERRDCRRREREWRAEGGANSTNLGDRVPRDFITTARYNSFRGKDQLHEHAGEPSSDRPGAGVDSARPGPVEETGESSSHQRQGALERANEGRQAQPLHGQPGSDFRDGEAPAIGVGRRSASGLTSRLHEILAAKHAAGEISDSIRAGFSAKSSRDSAADQPTVPVHSGPGLRQARSSSQGDNPGSNLEDIRDGALGERGHQRLVESVPLTTSDLCW